jgi:hypothetical protein
MKKKFLALTSGPCEQKKVNIYFLFSLLCFRAELNRIIFFFSLPIKPRGISFLGFSNPIDQSLSCIENQNRFDIVVLLEV